MQPSSSDAWAAMSLGRTLGSIKHLLPSFHPRHGLHVLPPVAVLDRPLLQRDTADRYKHDRKHTHTHTSNERKLKSVSCGSIVFVFNRLYKHTFQVSSWWPHCLKEAMYFAGHVPYARAPFVYTPSQCPLSWQTLGLRAGPWRLYAWSPAASAGLRQQTHAPASD